MISIVTSAYNASKTIKTTIESVLSQTYKNWELIVVNDASSDNTSEIVLSYCEKDSRIKLINHETNQGAGLSRRTGISNISGEYMTFLDSDDYLSPETLEVLLYFIEKYDVDIVAPGYVIVDTDGKIVEERKPDKKIIQSNASKFKPNKADTKRFMNPMLIKSHLWNNVEYSSRRFIEDTPTLVQILYWAKNLMLLDFAGYYYVQSPTSLIHSASDIKYLIYKTLCCKDITTFFKSVKAFNIFTDNFENMYKEVLNKCTDEDYIKYKDELLELKQYYEQAPAIEEAKK